MTFEESIVLALKVRPSALDIVYWSHTLYDLRTLTRLYMEQELVRAHSFTESLVLVVNQAFGGGESSETTAGPADEVSTADDAVNAVNDLLRGM